MNLKRSKNTVYNVLLRTFHGGRGSSIGSKASWFYWSRKGILARGCIVKSRKKSTFHLLATARTSRFYILLLPKKWCTYHADSENRRSSHVSNKIFQTLHFSFVARPLYKFVITRRFGFEKDTYSTISFFSNHNRMISKYWEFIQRGSIMLKVISLDFFSRTLKNARIE